MQNDTMSQKEDISQIQNYKSGNLSLNLIASLDGIEFPKVISGNLSLVKLKTAKNVKFPEKVEGTLNLEELEEVENVILPREITGDLWLSSIGTTLNLIMPERIDGCINLSSIEFASDVVLPEDIIIGKRIELYAMDAAETATLIHMLSANCNRPIKVATDHVDEIDVEQHSN
jgi:hypothetical protein